MRIWSYAYVNLRNRSIKYYYYYYYYWWTFVTIQCRSSRSNSSTRDLYCWYRTGRDPQDGFYPETQLQADCWPGLLRVNPWWQNDVPRGGEKSAQMHENCCWCDDRNPPKREALVPARLVDPCNDAELGVNSRPAAVHEEKSAVCSKQPGECTKRYLDFFFLLQDWTAHSEFLE